MAFLVTNPRNNGEVNKAIAKHIGADIRTQKGRDEVAAFKKTEAYRKGGWKSLISEKDLASARAAKKKKQAAKAKDKAAHGGKSGAKRFIEKVAKKPAKKKGGRKPAAQAPAAAAKPPRARRQAAKVSAPVLAAGVTEVKTKNGRVQYRKDGKLISKAAAFAKANGKKGKRHGRRFPLHTNGAIDAGRAYLMENLETTKILTTLGVGGVVGGAMWYFTPKVAGQVARIPYVGDAAAEYAPYTITGLAAGLVTFVIGAAAGQARYAAMIGAAAPLAGVALDFMGALNRRYGGEGYGDLAVVANPYGDLAVTANPYGDLAVTALPSYDGKVGLAGYGALGMVEAPAFGFEHLDYGDSEMADAFLAGDDFDAAEGQALIDGPRAMASRFPANRASGYRRKDGPYSRHAGKPMARWAWLIKLVGGEKARAIAALPPAERVRVIAGLKSQAQAYASRQLNAAARSEYAAVGAHYAPGASGVEGAYGAQMALGAGF